MGSAAARVAVVSAVALAAAADATVLLGALTVGACVGIVQLWRWGW